MVKAFAIGGFAALLCFVVVGAAGGLEAPGSGGQDSEVIKRLDEIKASLAVSQRIQFVDAHTRLFAHQISPTCVADASFPDACRKIDSASAEAADARREAVDKKARALRLEKYRTEAVERLKGAIQGALANIERFKKGDLFGEELSLLQVEALERKVEACRIEERQLSDGVQDSPESRDRLLAAFRAEHTAINRIYLHANGSELDWVNRRRLDDLTKEIERLSKK